MAKQGNNWQFVVESDIKQTKTGNDMIFGTALDVPTGSVIPFVAFGNTAHIVAENKLSIHQPQFTESDTGDRMILGVSVWADGKGKLRLA